MLSIIKDSWLTSHKKLSITETKEELQKNGIDLSHEKVRMLVDSIWKKGEILIDVQGRERMVRPNHVTINSKSHPEELRNFTVLDNDGTPIQRIWASIYKDEEGNNYLALSESRWNGSWKTTNNIIIPPLAVDEFKTLLQYILEKL